MRLLQGTRRPIVNRVPRWRVVAAIAILAGLVFFLGMFAPYYFRNLELQNFVSALTHRGENQTKSDDVLRSWVLDKAHQLDLPVKEDNVHITRSEETMQIDVRYVVRVSLPGYTVDLHFYPGAGSR
jgi:hypothetical protein